MRLGFVVIGTRELKNGQLIDEARLSVKSSLGNVTMLSFWVYYDESVI